ncbi:MAG: hypothetical protein MJ246_00765 [Clostridia bacterium]|nr:hypothetical protein [Clostridia bacterium]
MIKKLKFKKLIMQVIAFLLVFTLSFGDLLSLKVNAVEVQEGDTVKVNLHTSSTCSYAMTATYTSGA